MPPTIAIIGAGPAGSTAAFHLARAGLDVVVIESRRFPRVKVCGEFISPAATALLEAILPPDRLLAAGARRTDRFVLQIGDGERTLAMPSPAWALSRRSLDDLLLAAARAAGAAVLQPAPVARVDHDAPNGPAIRLADDRTIQADLVLHADGHARFCPTPPTPSARGLVAHKCHFVPPSPIGGVTIRAGADAYVGTIGVEPDERHPRLGTVALCARRQLLQLHQGDIDAMVRGLWPNWNPAARTTDWLSCGVARSGFQRSGHPRAFRLGNAAAGVDPVGGEGIGLAIWSGTTLARLLIDSLQASSPAPAPRTLAHLHRRYGALYRRRLRLRRPACFLAAEALMRPRLIRAAWPLLGIEFLTLAPWYAATGKPLRRHPQPCPTG
ncbi:MAG: tryptophan 7-halogenase [Phycisphaerales bacterium]|nr:tryptophan 7-halogenase [Phycisphaerales bacterium]